MRSRISPCPSPPTTSSSRPASPGRGRIYNSITETIGDTPLVRLDRLPPRQGRQGRHPRQARVLQPDRQRQGPHRRRHDRRAGSRRARSSRATVLIEPTSGNTGIALAFVAAARGYRLILVMPETMSIERRKMLALLGAELVLTAGRQGHEGRHRQGRGARRARSPDAVIPQQFENPANPEIHRRTTAEEIWNDTDGEVDVFVSGVGTGGTITGVGQVLKPRKPVAAGSSRSSRRTRPVLSGGQPGPHKIQGIGAGFVPGDPRPHASSTRSSPSATRPPSPRRARWRALEGIPVGISSGAAIAAALEVGARPEIAGQDDRRSSSRPSPSAISRPPCSRGSEPAGRGPPLRPARTRPARRLGHFFPSVTSPLGVTVAAPIRAGRGAAPAVGPWFLGG